MKNTDKVTLTVGQLKKLIKESRSIKESNLDKMDLALGMGASHVVHQMNVDDFKIYEKWTKNHSLIPYVEIAKEALDAASWNWPNDISLKTAIERFIKTKSGPIKQKIENAVDRGYSNMNYAIKNNTNDDIFYITYNDILDVLEDFDQEDIEELAEMDPVDADDWIYKYIEIPGFNGDGEVENIDHIGNAAIEVAMDLVHGNSIAKLRRKYGKNEI